MIGEEIIKSLFYNNKNKFITGSKIFAIMILEVCLLLFWLTPE
jgi:hypothetical protein